MPSKRELLATMNLSSVPEQRPAPVEDLVDEIAKAAPNQNPEMDLVKKSVYIHRYQNDAVDFLSYREGIPKSDIMRAIVDAGLDALHPGLRSSFIENGRESGITSPKGSDE